jgi:hypothetical protein
VKWLYRFLRLFICPHKWKTIGEGSLMKELFKPTGEQVKLYRKGSFFELKCNRCGDYKVRRLRGMK